VPRACAVLEAMVAFVLAEALLEKLGGDSLDEMLPRLAALRRARLSDLPMDGQSHVFWPGRKKITCQWRTLILFGPKSFSVISVVNLIWFKFFSVYSVLILRK